VDGLHNIEPKVVSPSNTEEKNLLFAIASLAPPSSYYQARPRSTKDVYMSTRWDWESYLKAPMFLDEYWSFRKLVHFILSPSSHLCH
jgi:hypothetical protein